MEHALRDPAGGQTRWYRGEVLILIVMEHALRAQSIRFALVMIISVLILIVMEHALRVVKIYNQDHSDYQS